MELEKLNVFIEINGVNQLVGNISGILSGNAVFTYTDEYISNPDSRPISISLPLEEKSFDSKRTKNFFEAYYRKGLQEPALHIGCIRKNRITYLFCMD